ncbi:hypothetical protein [Stappia indica]|uniref:Lipopolysaccharide assembly protein A domain-containing protein n=1 Tax=Stappia indica TaxID=538381 RepID=A0A857C4Y8_9HYPH|nr:hypothetical protein [Stappia indica]QGZ33948.1 hypothetical protein GH266_05130 [Stappia indica]
MMEIFGPWSAARVVVAGLLLLTIGLGVLCLWAAHQLERAVERRRRRRLLQKIQAVARRRLP